MFDVRRDLFAHLQRLSLRFHGGNQTGDLISRVTGDISNVQDMIVTVSTVVFSNVLSIAFVFLIMARLDWKYTLLTLGVVPAMYVAARYFQRRIRYAAMQVRRSEGQVSSIVQEVVSSIRVVKAFTREAFEQERFESQGAVSRDAALHMGKLQAQFGPSIDILGSFATVVLLWFGVREVLAGNLTAGELLVFVAYIRSMYSPLRQLARVSTTMARGAAGAERVLEIFRSEPDLDDRPDARTAPRLRGRIEFDGVSFGYEPDTLVLHDISFEAEPGSVVAVVGATGSGKTTTVSMIPRFYDPTAGVVRIDGEDIRNFTLRSLRSQISLVLQEPLLFRTSIYDNVAYGSESASPADVRKALAEANALEFVAQLPHGDQTVVGERGTSLSGGQRQRIAIARAMVRDAPILILDEPTVGLDPETEAQVLDALERLRADRTTFVIAHHLATVHGADQIVVLDEGRVVEIGTHQDLMRRNGKYARLYRSQDRSLGSATREAGFIA
jgi:ABC-type multidrug transport system fused ATPase/permease subunit